MVKIVKVELLATKSIYFAETAFSDLKRDNIILFKIDSTIHFGIVKSIFCVENIQNDICISGEILRIAAEDDLKIMKENSKDAERALFDAKKFSFELNLPMHFIDSFYTFDRSQLLLSFHADDRIDFRELAKKLAQKYKTRIELRQIGVRDKAKRIGGLGPCGLLLCCNNFLTDFNSVSINMAKNQFLALNPSKINGVCGRLFCCLDYENDLYTELRKNFPKLGSVIDTAKGRGKVVSIDVFKNTVSVDLKEKGILELDLKEDINEKNK